jgi:hypothetical protein
VSASACWRSTKGSKGSFQHFPNSGEKVEAKWDIGTDSDAQQLEENTQLFDFKLKLYWLLDVLIYLAQTAKQVRFDVVSHDDPGSILHCFIGGKNQCVDRCDN